MIPLIQCYVPPSVEILGLTTISFKPRPRPKTPSFQTRLTPLHLVSNKLTDFYKIKKVNIKMRLVHVAFLLTAYTSRQRVLWWGDSKTSKHEKRHECTLYSENPLTDTYSINALFWLVQRNIMNLNIIKLTCASFMSDVIRWQCSTRPYHDRVFKNVFGLCNLFGLKIIFHGSYLNKVCSGTMSQAVIGVTTVVIDKSLDQI